MAKKAAAKKRHRVKITGGHFLRSAMRGLDARVRASVADAVKHAAWLGPLGPVSVYYEKSRITLTVSGEVIYKGRPTVASSELVDRWVKYADLGLTMAQAKRLERERPS